MPDIDSIVTSLPRSRTNSLNRGPERDDRPAAPLTSESPHGSASPLTAAATSNAAVQLSRQDSRPAPAVDSPLLRHADRRRSSVLGSRFFDPSYPGPGETQHGDSRTESPASGDLRQLNLRNLHIGTSASELGGRGLSIYESGLTGYDHRDREPSLGELHQELEQEQEAQVNRLLAMIQRQQQQLLAIQQHGQAIQQQAAFDPLPNTMGATSQGSDLTRPLPLPSPPIAPFATSTRSSSPTTRFSLDQACRPSHSSRPPSRTRTMSPAVRPASAGRQERADDFRRGSSAQWQAIVDDTSFYQAEAVNLARENQMLKQRIRELERQLNDTPMSASTPTNPSNLGGPPLEAENEEAVSDS